MYIRSPKLPAHLVESEGFLQEILRQLKWLVFGPPQVRRRGTWVFNSRDRIWRYYLEDVEVK